MIDYIFLMHFEFLSVRIERKYKKIKVSKAAKLDAFFSNVQISIKIISKRLGSNFWDLIKIDHLYLIFESRL